MRAASAYQRLELYLGRGARLGFGLLVSYITLGPRRPRLSLNWPSPLIARLSTISAFLH